MAILNIHNEGKDIELDPMYNKGMFYKAIISKPKYRYDINALKNDYDAEHGDATALPLANSSINCMILDPPFMFGTHGQTKNSRINKRYTMFDTFEELEKCYKGILKESYRILKNNGILIFKCQDYTDNKTTMTHCLVYQWATEIGFYAKDIAILNLPKDKIYNGNLTQRHLRKTHCYFFVFQKKQRIKTRRNGGNIMTNLVKNILKANGLTELLDAVHDFCKGTCIRDDDTECMELVTEIKNKKDSDLHSLLNSYLAICENGDEVLESLYEFISNCKGFTEANKDMTQQVTKEEFEAVLEECEEKIALKTCIEKSHTLTIAEVPYMNKYPEFNIKVMENNISIFLPRIDINTDIKKYIAGELGAILYEVLKSKFTPDKIMTELNKRIPETTNSHNAAKQLFKRHFDSVVQYTDRKPGIYTHFDDHMKRVLEMGYYDKMIREYLL